MFCRKRRGTVLRKGIAAFLLLMMMGSSVASVAAVPVNITGETGENAVPEQSAVEGTKGSAAGEAAGIEGTGEAAGTEGTGEAAGTEGTGEAADAEETDAPEAELEEIGEIEIKVKDELTEQVMETTADEGGIVLFAQDEAEPLEISETGKAMSLLSVLTEPVFAASAENKSVTLHYTKDIEYESFETHNFNVRCDGKTIRAYCIEPSEQWGGTGSHTARPYNAALMKKALYYSYGCPGYEKKTKQYLAKVSRKSCYKGADGVYALCHIVLSYIYDNESSDSDAFKGVSADTRKVVKNFLKAIKSWPDPPGANIGMTPSKVTAKWNENKGRQETPKIRVTGSKGNSVSIPVHKGTSIVKGGKAFSSGKVKVKVGESFYITGNASKRGTYSSPEIAGTVSVFQPYILKLDKRQDVLFRISSKNYVSYKVKWVDFGTVNIRKKSSDESITADNSYYSIKDAKYGLYSSSTGKLYGTMKTDSYGKASLKNIPYGSYTIKEISAPAGYAIDTASHSIKLSAQAISKVYSDKPAPPQLKTSASEKGSGENTVTEGGTITITDTVEYSDLRPGLEYIMSGKLMDKESGEEIEGTSVDMTFTPETSEGSVQMEFSIDSSGMAGSTVVAFERLYYNDVLISSHEDINSEAQSVVITEQKQPATAAEKKSTPPAETQPQPETTQPQPETTQPQLETTAPVSDDVPRTGDTKAPWLLLLAAIMVLTCGVAVIVAKN